MPESIDPNNASFLVADLARLMRLEFERRIAEEPISVTPAEARVLAHVARGGTTRQCVLAERLGIGPMSMTGFLDRLEAAGLVARVPDSRDRRAKLVSLTEAARPVLATIARTGEAARARARGDIPEEDWRRFQEVARRVIANLRGEEPAERDTGA
ncbi:MarR family winged helix-turn-helix transcriptional regulator [Amaricoccus solimangrovi]|uniref:Winged helix-turn-helix transcriptional regulator n=1 Tax=Amaricoccus solimangrovi TaxID=2589815 RepID=A0A501WZL2_9RHOB|nr:MarR family winged helix-turn-helix transcriptional regulator [Amaricoccus solimangrovi]TPE53904.1 winged helix-turn-helix transcriptional regulator [Amaricoccus solimangrovi]